MVPPFALALAVGSYLFILSIYATLSYLHLHHHVQGAPATATWIDRGDDLTNASSLSTDHSKPVAPTVLHFALTSTSTLTMKRRQWDPGIRLAFSPMMASLYDDSSVGSCDRSPIDPTMNRSFAMVRRLRLRRQWDPGIAKDGIDRSFHLPMSHSNGVVIDRSFHLPSSHSNVVVVMTPWRLPCRLLRRLLRITAVGTPSLVASIFHYCHPVLSRPTVPNII